MTSETFLSLMIEMRKSTFGSHSISMDCRRLLDILLQTYAEHRDFVYVLEVGTGVGYSMLWLVKGLIDSSTEGKIYSIENVLRRAEIAKYNLKKATNIEGLEKAKDYVKIIYGNALDIIPELNADVDFAFIDGTKEEYLQYLKLILPRLEQGALVTAHNTISYRKRMEGFINEIMNPNEWSTVIIPIDAGLSLSIKKF